MKPDAAQSGEEKILASEKPVSRKFSLLPEKNVPHKFSLVELLFFIAMAGCLFGLLTPATKLVPEPFVQFLEDDSLQDQTLRVIAEIPLYYLIDSKTKEMKPFNKIRRKILLSIFDSPKNVKRRSVRSFPEVLLAKEVIETLAQHKVWPDQEVLNIVPEYDFLIPLAWYKTEQGKNHVVYHRFYFSLEGEPPEEFIDLFKAEYKREYNKNSEKDRHLLDKIRLRQKIKIRTDQELQKEIAIALEQIRKFPTLTKIQTQKENKK